MRSKKRFSSGLPVMCWNNDNVENAKMRRYLDQSQQLFSVVYPGNDSRSHVEYYEHICGLDEYRRYILTPSLLIQVNAQREHYAYDGVIDMDVASDDELRQAAPVQAGRVQSHI